MESFDPYEVEAELGRGGMGAAADLARALELLPGGHRFVPDCQQALARLRR